MDISLFFGGSVIAAVVAGALALFAPCCISVMLPAYFASSFENRGLRVAMTFLFAAGVATVILPLAMGAAILRQLVTAGHTPIYVTGGALMLALAIYIVFGGQLHLPAPGGRPSATAGPTSVYSLGLFSGIATSCCAPVLAGVIALAGVASSFLLALGLGVAYVFGMVMPLFVIALLWERFDWRSSWLFRPRSVTWSLAGLSRTVSGASLASALLLTIMGFATVVIGLQGDAMPAPTGWQANLSLKLQRVGQATTGDLAAIPGWVAGLVIAAVVALLAWRASAELGWTRQDVDAAESAGGKAESQSQERIIERQHA